MSITLGQIADALSAGAVRFGGIHKDVTNKNIVAGTASTIIGTVIYDEDDKAFYMAVRLANISSGVATVGWTYYKNWKGHDNFYDANGNIRTDVVFTRTTGQLYVWTGSALVAAGMTEAQAKQLTLLTPIEVESETALEQMEAAGLIVEGQIYYIPEND